MGGQRVVGPPRAKHSTSLNATPAQSQHRSNPAIDVGEVLHHQGHVLNRASHLSDLPRGVLQSNGKADSDVHAMPWSTGRVPGLLRITARAHSLRTHSSSASSPSSLHKLNLFTRSSGTCRDMSYGGGGQLSLRAEQDVTGACLRDEEAKPDTGVFT